MIRECGHNHKSITSAAACREVREAEAARLQVPDEMIKRILDSILAERDRAIGLHTDQSHLPDGTGRLSDVLAANNARRQCDTAAGHGKCTWRHILAEEVAEALAEYDQPQLRTELVQVAAVALLWIEAIDKRGAV